MSAAAATIPFTPSQPARPWTPDKRDRLIFQWVKFEGQTQSWVAAQLEISQSTVSRIIDRYERWIARGGPSQQGAPTHDERLRAQRWLTYERNEWMLASALRLAGEMERILDTSKSNITHHASQPSRQIEVRTEHRAIDRSGLAARYLRLAYRINMDQLKLVEQEPLPALDPLTIEDLGENAAYHGYPADAECHGHPARADRAAEADPSLDPSNSSSELTPTDDHPLNPDDAQPHSPDPSCPDPKTENRKLQTAPAPVSIIELTPNASPVHKTHKPQRSKSRLTTNPTTASAKSRPPKKRSAPAYAVASAPPKRTPPSIDAPSPQAVPSVAMADPDYAIH